MRVIYPPGAVNIIGERIIHVDNPLLKEEITKLNNELNTLKNAPPHIVEKIVEIRVPVIDKEIIKKYDQALKQIEALEKARLSYAQTRNDIGHIKYIPQEQTKLVEVPKLVYIKNKRQIVLSFISGIIVGSFFAMILLMASHVR